MIILMVDDVFLLLGDYVESIINNTNKIVKVHKIKEEKIIRGNRLLCLMGWVNCAWFKEKVKKTRNERGKKYVLLIGKFNNFILRLLLRNRHICVGKKSKITQ